MKKSIISVISVLSLVFAVVVPAHMEDDIEDTANEYTALQAEQGEVIGAEEISENIFDTAEDAEEYDYT